MIRKSSKQRDLILNYMKQIDGHVSAEQVFKDLNTNEQKISLATIYRNLNILVEMNEIKKIAHPIEGYQYDKTCIPHYHLHCIKCDRIV
ncbi:MAG: transcriptional repressor, partial [Longicatena sp.]